MPDSRVPRSRKGVETRARLISAAKEVFEDDGFLAARITDISDRAGLSHGSFYHYFDGKEEVFREVAEELDRKLSEPLYDVVLAPTGPAPEHRLKAAIRRHLESYQAEARMMGVIEQVSRYEPQVNELRAARREGVSEQIAESIRQLQKRGMADRSLDASIAAIALGGMVGRFAEMWLVQHFIECTLDEAVDQLTALYVNALGIRSARA